MIKIAVADDERLWCQAFCRANDWSKKGFEIVGVAYTGLAAYQLCMEKKPDILLTDIRMPGLDGLELLRRVKDEMPQIHVIILSAYSEFEYARKAMRYKADEYLLKNETEFETITAALEKIKKQYAIKKYDAPNVLAAHMRNPHVLAPAGGTLAEPATLALLARVMPDVCSLRPQIGERGYLAALQPGGIQSILTQLQETNLFLGAAPLEGEELNEAFRRAREAAEYARFYQLESHFSLYGTIAYCEAMSLLPPDEYMNVVRLGNWQAACRYLDTLAERAARKKDVRPQDLLNTFAWGIRVVTLAQKAAQTVSAQSLVATLQHSPSLVALQDSICHMKEELFEPLIAEQKRKGIITEALAYIHAHITDNISLWQTAQALHVSSTYLSTLFKAQMKLGFSQYVQHMKVEQADQLLQKTDMRIREIALLLGFSNESYFTQAYKRIKGISPKAFREQHNRTT